MDNDHGRFHQLDIGYQNLVGIERQDGDRPDIDFRTYHRPDTD